MTLTLQKCVNNKLLSIFPNNPHIRGSFFKLNKEYAKQRKHKKREFRQNILDKLDQLNKTNPKEYWNLVKHLRETEDTKENLEKSVDENTWFNYFTTLSKLPEKYKERINTIETNINELLNSKDAISFSKLDFRISAPEIQKAINSLKSGKSPGLDNISNEMIKASQIYINSCILKLFNLVLTSGIYPEKWLEGYTTPIFKSDNPKLPQNYRGITINNSIAKLFNIILNNRLNTYLIEHKIIHETQIGFSKESRTSDHLFVAKCLIDKYINTGNKRLYACFVDFRKAFDTVIHEGIKLKLLQLNINGLFFNILCNMYRHDQNYIKVGNKLTPPYRPEIGVRQGDVLSPNIFKIFLNDFSKLIDEESIGHVTLSGKKISSLLYADDLVLLSDNQKGLQDKLDLLYKYCTEWCLEINTNKTKVVIFNKSGHLINEKFTFENSLIECVNKYKYLGVILSSCGSFKEARSHLYYKALKASFKLYKDLKSIHPSIKTLLHLFDHMIKPIALYGCEIWGTLTARIQEKDKHLHDIFKEWEAESLNIKFCKYILEAGKKSTNIAIISELGRYPMYFSIIQNILLYWHRLQSSPESSLLHKAYKENINLSQGNVNCWYKNVIYFSKKINLALPECKTFKITFLKKQVKKHLKKHFLQYWKMKREEGLDSGKLTILILCLKKTLQWKTICISNLMK